jgi:anti-sigma factor RsiW
MDCARLRSLLDEYLDRELDPEASIGIAEHLRACDDCSRAVAARSALGTAIRKDAAYYRAPPALASRIRAQVAQTTARTAPKSSTRRFNPLEWRRWLSLGAAVAATVVATSFATLQLAGTDRDETLVAQLISGRSRSIVTGHEIDVASSDQHTVKPWLSSKLDFSPNVTDLAAAGFPLRGGRLDYLNDRPVAVLVYGHRQHLIDLFIWPEETTADKAPSRTFSKRGMNVLHWTAAGMTYWAVSDITKADLEEFADRYASATKSP